MEICLFHGWNDDVPGGNSTGFFYLARASCFVVNLMKSRSAFVICFLSGNSISFLCIISPNVHLFLSLWDEEAKWDFALLYLIYSNHYRSG